MPEGVRPDNVRSALLLFLLAWLIPGAGHFSLGKRQKAYVFALVLPAMFVIGLLLKGRIPPFVLNDPLVGLAAVANLLAGVPYLLARLFGAGAGVVTAITYEYGNTFMIAAGLLNTLVVLDAFDIARGRK
jgi:4-amino-4-deoxy-L-arabinose transferase-like glycosyltransferase